MLEETETEETRGFFVTCLSLVTFQLGAGSLATPMRAGQFVLEIKKRLATSEAEFNSLVGAGMGAKPFGTKAAVIFAFRNRFKFGREGARRLR